VNVSCPECRSVFRIDPAKVPDAGIRARCNVCGAVVSVERVQMQDAALPAALAVLAPEPPRAADDSAGETRADGMGSVDTTAPISRPSVPQISPTREPRVPTMATTMAPTSFEVTTAAPTLPAPDASPLLEARPRPINPYLNNTPELRARRLARALVSDLVAYNPQKREQGLRDGTLRQLFRDEIRKSWDEYVEQVGASVAESTPHFQDALNDVLAGGRRVF